MKTLFLISAILYIFAADAWATTPPQFVNLSSCQLSANPAVLTNNCAQKDTPLGTPLPNLLIPINGDFGANFFRVAVPNGVTENPTGLIPTYSKAAVWNSDGTVMLLMGTNGYPYLFHGATYAFIRRLEHPSNYVYDGQDLDARWSKSNPDELYYRSGMSLYVYSVASNTSSVVHTFTTGETGVATCTAIKNGDEGNADNTDRYWAFWCQDASYTAQSIISYDKQTDTVLSSKSLTAGGICGAGACPSVPNWVGVSHTGYVAVQWNTNSATRAQALQGKGTEIFNRNNLSFISQVSENYNHGDFAVMADGTDVYIGDADVNEQNGYHALRVVRASDGTAMKSCMVGYSSTWALGSHISGRTDDTKFKGWVLVSTYNQGNQSGNGMNQSKFAELAVALNIDTCEARYITHTHNNYAENLNPYNGEPHASMNYNFSKIVYQSNWENSNNPPLAYVVELPEQGLSDTTPPVTSSSVPAGRYQATQTVTLSASETADILYCLTLGTSCTPVTAYTTAVKVGRNTPQETICFGSTDTAENEEEDSCIKVTKQCRRSPTCHP